MALQYFLISQSAYLLPIPGPQQSTIRLYLPLPMSTRLRVYLNRKGTLYFRFCLSNPIHQKGLLVRVEDCELPPVGWVAFIGLHTVHDFSHVHVVVVEDLTQCRDKLREAHHD